MEGAGYEVRYLVPTASGSTHEHGLKLGSFHEYRGVLKMCKRLGYTLVVNSMCERCAHFKNDCHGEANHVYTGCVARKVSRDVRAAL